MSRFRPDKLAKATERVPVARPSDNLVPMPAEEFARQRRQKFIQWGSAGAIVALVILSFLYRSSIPSTALNNYLDAKKLFDSGKYADALAAVEPATRDKAKRVEAYQLRTAILRAMHQPKDALADITRVIKLRPDDPANYDTRAQTYLELEDPTNAVKDYTRLIELNKSAMAYNNRGLCYLKLGQPRKALDDFTAAIERDPSMEFYLQRGFAWAAIGDQRKAIQDFDNASQLKAENSAIYRARANSKEQLGDRAGAERDRQLAANMERPQVPTPKQVVLPRH